MPAAPLYRANRRSARIALYASTGLILVFTVLLVGVVELGRAGEDADLGWEPMDYGALEEVRLLQEYLRIDTTPQGSELAGARFLADVFAADGIRSEVIDMGNGRANLIAVLEGARPEALVLHNHIDVEPILQPDRWAFPPFAGHIELPWIYGRGAFDMKSVTIAQVMAILELRRRRVEPRRSVIFLATSGEEIGSDLGTVWLLRERPELFDRAWVVLTEGGVVEARSPTDIKYWGTETGQKRYLEVTACSPRSEPLRRLRQELRSMQPRFDHLRVTQPVARFLEAYAGSRDLPLHRELLAQPEATIRDLERFRRLAPYQQALFRDELSAFRVEETPDGTAHRMRITLALLPDSAPGDVLERLLPAWITHGVRLVVSAPRGSAATSPPGHPVFLALQAAIRDHFGNVPMGPYYQPRSATDARHFRARGIPSYGFSPFPVLTTDTIGIGGPNEGIALPAFVTGVGLYVDAVERLLTES